ncbi:MAG: hypothetical protein LBU65_00260 [Planctomycetaceae bacterium]|nr:hypothetical protein [Planctomycetaceae bacterium]
MKDIKNNFLQALNINHSSAEAHYELGMFYDTVMGKSQDGIKHLKMARQILQQQLCEVEQGMMECVEFDAKRDFPYTSDFQKMKQKQFSRQDFCCDSLFTHLLENEVAVVYIREFREYGIKILDGGTSMQTIDYCPWCGIKLPESLRKEWFDTLMGMGYENPLDEDIPKQYRTDKWWKDKLLKIVPETH